MNYRPCKRQNICKHMCCKMGWRRMWPYSDLCYVVHFKQIEINACPPHLTSLSVKTEQTTNLAKYLTPYCSCRVSVFQASKHIGQLFPPHCKGFHSFSEEVMNMIKDWINHRSSQYVCVTSQYIFSFCLIQISGGNNSCCEHALCCGWLYYKTHYSCRCDYLALLLLLLAFQWLL